MSQPTEAPRCVTCGGEIEYVTDAGDPYWRHVDPTVLHGLEPTRPAHGEELYERTEETGSATTGFGGFRVGKDVDPDDLPGGAL